MAQGVAKGRNMLAEKKAFLRLTEGAKSGVWGQEGGRNRRLHRGIRVISLYRYCNSPQSLPIKYLVVPVLCTCTYIYDYRDFYFVKDLERVPRGKGEKRRILDALENINKVSKL